MFVMANNAHSVLGRARNALSSRSKEVTSSRNFSDSALVDRITGLSNNAPLLTDEWKYRYLPVDLCTRIHPTLALTLAFHREAFQTRKNDSDALLNIRGTLLRSTDTHS